MIPQTVTSRKSKTVAKFFSQAELHPTVAPRDCGMSDLKNFFSGKGFRESRFFNPKLFWGVWFSHSEMTISEPKRKSYRWSLIGLPYPPVLIGLNCFRSIRFLFSSQKAGMDLAHNGGRGGALAHCSERQQLLWVLRVSQDDLYLLAEQFFSNLTKNFTKCTPQHPPPGSMPAWKKQDTYNPLDILCWI